MLYLKAKERVFNADEMQRAATLVLFLRNFLMVLAFYRHQVRFCLYFFVNPSFTFRNVLHFGMTGAQVRVRTYSRMK